MRTKLLLIVSIFLVFAGSFLARQMLCPGAAGTSPQSQRPMRIISMAPSVTETLFALGVGDRVVGASRFCKYPPEVAGVARIGGLLDPNFEAIVLLEPDLIVMLEEHRQSMPALEKLGLPSLAVRHKDVDGIIESIPTIGRACDAEETARNLVADLEARVQRVRRKTAGLSKPRVLIAVDRTPGVGRPEDVFVASADGYFDRIIALAGGRNACGSTIGRFPVVSAEGILSMNPQVIVDLAIGMDHDRDEKGVLSTDWQSLSEVEAVAQRRVHAFKETYATVPGPRFILLLERLARLIHPEVDWQ